MTVKYIKKQVLQENGWLKGIYAVWGHYKDIAGNWLNPKRIPYGERPYTVAYCEKCELQRIHKLCDSTKEYLVFECDFCREVSYE